MCVRVRVCMTACVCTMQRPVRGPEMRATWSPLASPRPPPRHVGSRQLSAVACTIPKQNTTKDGVRCPKSPSYLFI